MAVSFKQFGIVTGHDYRLDSTPNPFSKDISFPQDHFLKSEELGLLFRACSTSSSDGQLEYMNVPQSENTVDQLLISGSLITKPCFNPCLEWPKQGFSPSEGLPEIKYFTEQEELPSFWSLLQCGEYPLNSNQACLSTTSSSDACSTQSGGNNNNYYRRCFLDTVKKESATKSEVTTLSNSSPPIIAVPTPLVNSRKRATQALNSRYSATSKRSNYSVAAKSGDQFTSSSTVNAVLPAGGNGKSVSRKNLGPALNTNLKPRARHGSASDPQSVAARHRRERINSRLKILEELVPNGSKVDLVTMLEKAINYVKVLQLQLQVLSNDDYWPNQEKLSQLLKGKTFENNTQQLLASSVGENGDSMSIFGEGRSSINNKAVFSEVVGNWSEGTTN